MTAHQARTLAIKLFGLYAATRTIFSLASWIATAISYVADQARSQANGFVEDTMRVTGTFEGEFGGRMFFGQTVSHAIWFGAFGLIAYICLFKTNNVTGYLFSDNANDGNTEESYQGPYSLAFFITIIAFFYAIPAIAEILTGMTHFVLNLVGTNTFYSYHAFWQQLITLIIALIALNWSRTIEHTITGQNRIEDEDVVKQEDHS